MAKQHAESTHYTDVLFDILQALVLLPVTIRFYFERYVFLETTKNDWHKRICLVMCSSVMEKATGLPLIEVVMFVTHSTSYRLDETCLMRCGSRRRSLTLTESSFFLACVPCKSHASQACYHCQKSCLIE